jgi:mannose-6-phosphate isomerase class I
MCYVDVPELLATLKYVLEPVPRVLPKHEGLEDVWSVPCPEFQLSRVKVDGSVALKRTGPEVLLCFEGALTAPLALTHGRALWLDAADGDVTLKGKATVFRVVVP